MQFMQSRKKPEKNSALQGGWTHDLAILVQCSNQLSYEATDFGSWWIICSYVAVKEMNVIDVYEKNFYIHLSQFNACIIRLLFNSTVSKTTYPIKYQKFWVFSVKALTVQILK